MGKKECKRKISIKYSIIQENIFGWELNPKSPFCLGGFLWNPQQNTNSWFSVVFVNAVKKYQCRSLLEQAFVSSGSERHTHSCQTASSVWETKHKLISMASVFPQIVYGDRSISKGGTGGSRSIRIWIIRIPGSCKVLQKSHVDLSCVNLPN